MGATFEPRDIEVLEWFHCVRKRPGMYVGPIDEPETLTTCVRSLVETCIELGSKRVIVSVLDDLSVEVVGEGASVPLHPKLASHELFFTVMSDVRRNASPAPFLWPLWPSSVNALSASFVVESVAAGARTRVAWRAGLLCEPEHVVGRGTVPALRLLAELDPVIFGPVRLDPSLLDEALADVSILAPGARIHVLDRRSGTTREHHAPNGLADHVTRLGAHDPLVCAATLDDGTGARVALGWCGDGPARVDAWVAGGFTGRERAVFTVLGLVGDTFASASPRPARRGPGTWLPDNAARGLVAAVALAGPPTAESIDHATLEALEPVLAPYVLARPALLAQIARNTGCTAEELAARLDSRIPDQETGVSPTYPR
ncbi:hypothetical protein [Sandaracinus amylolyticus]|uniref:hypothetical protein n=1 Tax=Sandaracinus amylolyticus TaxID=927083 RepID=UPI001F388C8A|nr:hypothetical protein [Sandaracinus amylolyticus]UJR78967.1 Hypothetical protein I5071_10000 [Sandaracinus amylolyticus]